MAVKVVASLHFLLQLCEVLIYWNWTNLQLIVCLDRQKPVEKSCRQHHLQSHQLDCALLIWHLKKSYLTLIFTGQLLTFISCTFYLNMFLLTTLTHYVFSIVALTALNMLLHNIQLC